MAEKKSRYSNKLVLQREWKPAFLAAFTEGGHVSNACKTVGIHKSTAYRARVDDIQFANAWDEAERVAAAVLEEEARRRAVEGVEEPVFHRGEVCGTVRKYSDVLLIFLLKGLKPEKYRERYESNVNVNGELRVTDVAAIRERFVADILRHAAGGDTKPDSESLH